MGIRFIAAAAPAPAFVLQMKCNKKASKKRKSMQPLNSNKHKKKCRAI